MRDELLNLLCQDLYVLMKEKITSYYNPINLCSHVIMRDIDVEIPDSIFFHCEYKEIRYNVYKEICDRMKGK